MGSLHPQTVFCVWILVIRKHVVCTVKGWVVKVLRVVSIVSDRVYKPGDRNFCYWKFTTLTVKRVRVSTFVQ